MSLIILPDSPFRNPPTALDPKQRHAVDAFRFAIDMAGISYGRLIAGLHRVGELRADGRWSAEMTAALADAWSVVDNIWRISRVVLHFPGLKRSPEIELCVRAFATVEGLRNGIQHLSGEFTKNHDRPLFGVLSWLWTPTDPLRGGDVITFAAGAIREGEIPALNPLGKACDTPVGLVTLTAFGTSVNLSELIARVQWLADGLDKGFRRAVEGLPTAGSDPLMCMRIAFGAASEPPAKS